MQNRRCILLCLFVGLAVLLALPAKGDWPAAKRAYDEGDYAVALKEVRPLADQGNAEAQALLGLMYDLGRGLPRDMSRAMKWYRAAALQGNAAARCHLGSIYLKTDPAQGLRLLKISASQGYSEAYLILGLAYLNLRNSPRDPVQADMWFQLAIQHGDPMAPRQASMLESLMTRDQISEAHALAKIWEVETLQAGVRNAP